MFQFTPKSNQTKPLKDLLVLQTCDQILDKRRFKVVNAIKELLNFDEGRYNSLVLTLIHHLAEFCQQLPETLNSYYSEPGGLLDYHLERALSALQLLNRYLIVESDQVLSEEQKLWQYVLVSAALLQGIGKLYYDYQLTLYDANGQVLKACNPLVENPITVGRYYDYKNKKDIFDEEQSIRSSLNLLLARLLMPTAGFTWISSSANPQAFEAWLRLLDEEGHFSGTLEAVLSRAKALTIQSYFEQLKLTTFDAQNSQINKISTFGDNTDVEIVEKKLAIEFLAWMKDGIDGQKITLNKAPVFTVPGGLLITTDMFKLFIRENPEFKNWQAVQGAFLHLNLHTLNHQGDYKSRFKQGSHFIEGILLKNSIVLPEKLALWAKGKKHLMSALEWEHGLKNSEEQNQLASLSNTGEWLVSKTNGNDNSLSQSQR